jgi:hypothetical protein
VLRKLLYFFKVGMSEWHLTQSNISAEFAASERKRYAGLLAPLFSPQDVDTFEYACALLRVGGCQDAGWDPLQESREVLRRHGGVLG